MNMYTVKCMFYCLWALEPFVMYRQCNIYSTSHAAWPGEWTFLYRLSSEHISEVCRDNGGCRWTVTPHLKRACCKHQYSWADSEVLGFIPIDFMWVSADQTYGSRCQTCPLQVNSLNCAHARHTSPNLPVDVVGPNPTLLHTYIVCRQCAGVCNVCFMHGETTYTYMWHNWMEMESSIVCTWVCQQFLSALIGHTASLMLLCRSLETSSHTHLSLSPQLYDIWLQHNACVSTSLPCPYPCLPNAVGAQLPELRQFLVPCVKCHLTLRLPVGVWGTFLSGVGEARQLEQLKVHMWGKPVSILQSLHIVGVSDVMWHVSDVLVCRRRLVQSGTTLTRLHWRRWRHHGHTASVGK